MNKYSFEEIIEDSFIDREQVGIETFFEVANASDFKKKFDIDKFSKKLRFAMSTLEDKNVKIKRTGQKKPVIHRVSENTYSFFHSFESFFYSWLDIEAPKELYSTILDINEQINSGKEIIFNIYTAWDEFAWEFILFISVHGLWFNNLIFDTLKAKKVVHIDTWCNIGSLLAASYADEIVVGDFADVIITLGSTSDYSKNIQEILDENKKNILERIYNKGLLTKNEVETLLLNPIESIFINSKELKRRVIEANKK